MYSFLVMTEKMWINLIHVTAITVRGGPVAVGEGGNATQIRK